MLQLIRSSLRPIYRSYLRRRTPRFWALAHETRGMLNPMVYEYLYKQIAASPDMDVVEIGGAGGAASIAMALGIKESGKKSKLLVVEKCEGGTRDQYGSYTDNLHALEQNFARFGVTETIRLFPHWLTFENGSAVTEMIGTPEIAAFMHDADGRLDRDFHFFWPRLRTGGLIIVDDYVDERDLKHAVTWRLLNQFIEWELFEPTHRIRNTVFGRKPVGADIKRLDLEVCRKIVDGVAKAG